MAAEEVRPEPGSIQPESQVEAEPEETFVSPSDSSDQGRIQLLNFLPPGSPPVAVFLSGEGISEAVWPNRLRPLIRGSISPDTRPFEWIPEGEYHVMVREEKTRNFASEDPDVRIPKFQKGEELAPVAELKVEPGSTSQLVIWSSESGPEITIQTTNTDESQRSLEVWNIIENLPIRLLAGNGETESLVAASLPFGPNKFPLPQVPVTMFRIEYPKKSGSVGSFPLEMEVGSNQNIILVAFRDKYGRIAFQGFGGATIGR